MNENSKRPDDYERALSKRLGRELPIDEPSGSEEIHLTYRPNPQDSSPEPIEGREQGEDPTGAEPSGGGAVGYENG